MPKIDPREIITPSSFVIAPELLGRPLARPWRRLAAFLIDLMLIGILVGLLQEPSIFFGALLALLLFRVTRARGQTSSLGRLTRGALRLTAAVIVFGIAIATWSSIAQAIRDADEPPVFTKRTGPDGRVVLSAEGSLTRMGVAFSDIIALATISNDEEARAVSTRIRNRLVAAGITAEDAAELRGSIESDMGGASRRAGLQALVEALREIEGTARDSTTATIEAAPPVDALALDFGAALREGDRERADALRVQLTDALARDTLSALERRYQRLRSRADELQATVDRLKGEREEAGHRFSIVHAVKSILDDLGIGFGWMALYFTAFLTLWKGRTPGKRILRIRVIRLDGKPIGWWAAFERFGGYAAGLVTGLLGFLQIYWDRNRQAIHDKISETVVVRE